MSDDPNDFDPLFHASCRTVSSVSAQIADLKKAADEMATYASSLKREYLTPTEDEAARRILITYWQLRNALLEMVHELRMQGARDRRRYDKLFLPGYAGALVSVDAARFLRDRFHHSTLVRRKLNEPEPSFEIPAGAGLDRRRPLDLRKESAWVVAATSVSNRTQSLRTIRTLHARFRSRDSVSGNLCPLLSRSKSSLAELLCVHQLPSVYRCVRIDRVVGNDHRRSAR